MSLSQIPRCSCLWFQATLLPECRLSRASALGAAEGNQTHGSGREAGKGQAGSRDALPVQERRCRRLLPDCLRVMQPSLMCRGVGRSWRQTHPSPRPAVPPPTRPHPDPGSPGGACSAGPRPRVSSPAPSPVPGRWSLPGHVADGEAPLRARGDARPSAWASVTVRGRPLPASSPASQPRSAKPAVLPGPGHSQPDARCGEGKARASAPPAAAAGLGAPGQPRRRERGR